uniref:Transthyretin-like family-containing protein n=1 Tax=Rhabditophanes sp. KR3021 TaxID=114890 RepID=A0AC35U7S6_9BILA
MKFIFPILFLLTLISIAFTEIQNVELTGTITCPDFKKQNGYYTLHLCDADLIGRDMSLDLQENDYNFNKTKTYTLKGSRDQFFNLKPYLVYACYCPETESVFGEVHFDYRPNTPIVHNIDCVKHD